MRSKNLYYEARFNEILDALFNPLSKNDVKSHMMRVRNITVSLYGAMADEAGYRRLTNNDYYLIGTASALHDIGKSVVPDKILNKSGRLTDIEFIEIKKHTIAGVDILMKFTDKKMETDPVFKAACDICRWHHERWDGMGYPDGLRGSEIPIYAQMVSLADVYDALTNERCYKKAYSHQEAMTMILNGECGAFNPAILNSFQRIVKFMN